MFWCSALERVPTVARHSARTIRISEDGRRRVTISPSFGDQLDRGAGGAAELAALAGDQLDVMDDRAGRHLAQGQRVARFDVGLGAGLDRVADRERAGARM